MYRLYFLREILYSETHRRMRNAESIMYFKRPIVKLLKVLNLVLKVPMTIT